MGTTFYSCAIIGVRLSFHALHEYKKVKAFDHNHPESWKVCPESGRQLWVDTWELKPFATGEQGWDVRIKGFKVVEGEYEDYREGRHWQYVALCSVQSTSDDRDAKRAPLDMTSERLANFREVLTEVGVWDEKAFGLWAVLSAH